MSVAASTDQAPELTAEPKKGGRKKLLLAIPVLLALVCAGLWFSGILPGLLGMGGAQKPKAEAEQAPSYLELPDIVANLNTPKRGSFVKLKSRLEFARGEDVDAAKIAMPRLLDLFGTYLREMRPEELRGSVGTYRLREELLARANVVLAPVRVRDILFTEILVQ